MKKIVSLLLVLITVVVAVAGCGATPEPEVVEKIVTKEVEVTAVPEDETIVLRFANWATAEEATRAIFLKAIDEFKATHPNVEIELIALPFDQVRPQLITMSAGGNPPDIVQLNGAWPHELGAMGFCAICANSPVRNTWRTTTRAASMLACTMARSTQCQSV